jgi:excisionase family DNA binding protein
MPANTTTADIVTASIQDFIRISGLGNTTVYQMLNRGEIESVNVGRRRLIVIDSYRRYLARHVGTPAASPLADPPRRGRVCQRGPA